jgi:hypothetical protein
MSRARQLLSVIAFPLSVAALSAIACYRAAGPTLGLFLGLLVFVALLVPPILAAARETGERLTSLTVIVVPLVITWLIASWHNEMRLSEWAASSLVLAAFAVGLSGLSAALSVTRIGRHTAGLVVVLLGLAWLTWPIWLSRTWDGEASSRWVNPLVALHPGLAINYPHLGQWAEQSIAYHLTDLNQNVPYAPPRTVAACVVFHLVIGAGLLVMSGWVERRRARVAVAADSASEGQTGAADVPVH